MKLIVIQGPTAIGKTKIAIEMAKILGGEIISADSRQVYKELEIGTAKPSKSELEAIPHHFINIRHINEYYSAGMYEREVLDFLKNNRESSNYYLVGGSGLYIKAVCEGIDDTPGPDFLIRNDLVTLYEAKGLDPLVKELQESDPETAGMIDLMNPKRVIRALEVIRQTSMKFSDIKKNRRKNRDFSIFKIGLELDRALLFDRINLRADEMIKAGLVAEAESFYDQRDLASLQTVGYQEFFGFFNGDYNQEEAIRLFKRNSRRYAKRQMTWFKRDQTINWFSPNDFANILKAIRDFLGS